MIEKIAHLADIHIRRATDRHFEYEHVFQNLYTMLKKDSPDRIVIVGDLYNDYIEFQGEAMTLAGRFLNSLSEIAPVIVTRGNHDIRKKNLNRQDFIKTIVELLANDKIRYFDESGVYEDENVSWCVWHHPDKQGPDTSKAKGIKIDLFHDPIYSSISVNGYRMDKEHYLKLDAFSGTLGLFGDIHQRQFFSSKKKAYPGSLVQQGYDEPLNGHGYLLWTLSTLDVEERDVPNIFGYHTVDLGPNTDFDNLYTDQEFRPNPRIRVRWVGNRADINKTNEIKIRSFLDQFNPIEIRIDKEALNISMTTVAGAQLEDIDDVVVQQEIFTEYLSQQEYTPEQIQNILEIDNVINKRMESVSRNNYSWQLKQLWLDNFKSFGDDVFLPIEDVKGLLQVTGENAQGKTTILDAICYLLYGKTLSTTKKEKHGDARFINNKRTLDYCKVGGVLEANGKHYVLIRRTDRTLNKKGAITQCTSTLYVYSIDVWDGSALNFRELKPDDCLTGELLRNTQKMLDEILGDFDDFIRTVLTNADNLNEMLSIDRAKFIDSVNRDAGLDVFEKKLEEYKNWKRSYDDKNPRLNVDVVESNKQIAEMKAYIERYEEDLSKNLLKKEETVKELQALGELKMTLAGQLIPIDPGLEKVSISNIEFEIDALNKSLQIQIEKNKDLEQKANSKPQTFDDKQLTIISEKIQTANDVVNDCLNKWQNLNSEIKDIERSIVEIDNRKKTAINSVISEIGSQIKEKETEFKIITESLLADKKVAANLKESISQLEKSKTCITCGQELTEEHVEHVKTKIVEKESELTLLKESYIQKNAKGENIKNEISVLKNKQSEISEGVSLPDDLISLLKKLEEEKVVLVNDVSTKKSALEKLTDEGKNQKAEVKNLQEQQKEIQGQQQGYVEGLQLKQEAQKCLIKKEQIEKEILEKESVIKSLSQVEKDKAFNVKKKQEIADIEIKEKTVKNNIDSIENENRNIQNSIHDLNRNIQETEKVIQAYLEQLERDKLHKAYVDCVHRDGVPTMLLKRMVGNINDEMATLLAGQEYICYFDENLILRLSHTSKLEASQNAIESSGKERTFVSLALKMALRNINRRSKPNFVMFDEIMGKLINKSIDEFSILLNKIKEKVESVFIIEHVHPVDFDHQLEIGKDEYDVSYIKQIS